MFGRGNWDRTRRTLWPLRLFSKQRRTQCGFPSKLVPKGQNRTPSILLTRQAFTHMNFIGRSGTSVVNRTPVRQ
jgi:hypothetical protein